VQNMSLAPIAERVFTVKEGSNGGSIEEMENELASPAYPKKSRKTLELLTQ